MPRAGWITAWLILVLGVCAVSRAQMAFEYPSALLDAYDADESCWLGMGLWGTYPQAVVPRIWLVGPPPSDDTAVSMPTDHWMELLFPGPLVSNEGADIEILEPGAAGELALVFVTDGADQEYALGLAQSADTGGEVTTHIGMELADFPVEFVPRALRIVALDRGGNSPGFDLASVRAWVLQDCGQVPRYPNPADELAEVALDATLSWTPTCGADIHTVYFSADRQAVARCAPESEFPLIEADANSFEPLLELGQTYYWGVAEANSADFDDVRLSDVWSFSVTDTALIDDFESYVEGGPPLYDAWYPLDRAQASLDQGAFHSCRQGLAFGYYYDNYYEGAYSELSHLFDRPQNWIGFGARFLELWLYGDEDNSTGGQMYLVVDDGDIRETVPLVPDANALATADWQLCRIPLSEFMAVDLTHVVDLGIGISRALELPEEYGSGTVVIDDIALRSTASIEKALIRSDLNADHVVDYRDLDLLSSDWLRSQIVTLPTTEPEAPVVWYKFDGDALDSVGTAHGQVAGRPVYAVGKHGQAIRFQTDEDMVSMTQVASVFGTIRDAMTISFWQYGEVSDHRNDTICCSNYAYGQSNPSISVQLGCWRDPGQYRWDCGTPWSIANRVSGHHTDAAEWSGRWNHWAFVKDRVSGKMEIYLNGMLYDSRTGTDSPIEAITSFQIGTGWYGRYDGLIDDFQIYDYALDAAQVAYLASDGTGSVERATLAAADLDATGTVDFTDYAIFATTWQDAGLQP